MRKPSPFDLPPDLEGQENALTTALQIVRGFALYFVVSEPSRVRPRLMDAVETRLAGKTIQRITVPPGSVNLLHVLGQGLTDPLPDIVFVDGLESSVYGAADPRSHPLLLNLNATRNNLYALLPRPVVLWVPLFVLKAITDAAPDFISVRSGVYPFPLDPEERQAMAAAAAALGQTRVLGLGHSERDSRIAEMQGLLSEYRSLPIRERNPLDEALILNQLGVAYTTLGNYAEAEPLYNEALVIRRNALPAGHLDIAASLNSLANFYHSQGRYNEAEPLFLETLAIARDGFPKGHSGIAASLNNLAGLYNDQGRYTEAEPLLLEAVETARKALSEGHVDSAASLSNLAIIYKSKGCYAEAETLFFEVLEMVRKYLPADHPRVATSLNNLAGLYRIQGRYAEAEPMFVEALDIHRKTLPQGHSDIALNLNNLASLYNDKGYFGQTERLFDEALELVQTNLEENHPVRQAVEDNVAKFKSEKAARNKSLSLSLQKKTPPDTRKKLLGGSK